MRIFAAGAVFMAAGVGLGAFGAHGLRHIAGEADLARWQTAALYQYVHALGLLAVGAAAPRLRRRPARLGAMLLAAGILVFSGSLYALVLGGWRWLGAVTPLGGLAFIAGWVAIALACRSEQR